MIPNKGIDRPYTFMLFFLVFATHQSRSSLPARSSFLSCSHSSLFFSEDCALFSATALSQPLAYQTLPHSFHRDGGCTPYPHRHRLPRSRRGDEKTFPATHLESVLTNGDARNSFRFRFYENAGVVVSLAKIFSERLEVLAKNLKLYLKFVSLSRTLCSLFSLLAQRAFHNSCA